MLETLIAMSPKSASTRPPASQHLNELPSGARAVVQRIDSDDIAIQQLMAMGLCLGRQIEVIRHGNPLIIRLLGARVGVAGRLARHILVERCD